MSNIFGDLSPKDFLNHYWQKRPLLLQQALPNFATPIEPDELAGLACEPEVESRLVIEQGDTPWQLKTGPFSDEDFSALPPSHWTLLVQAVDQWVPEIHQLLQQFDFIPNWRRDDIMVSYASKGGSVGPHFDYYDVFLLQAKGRREWQVGSRCHPQMARVKDTPLHILQEFQAEHRWVLEPGDILYLPPMLGHHGIALDDSCMTFSIGFRAPSTTDILQDYTQEVCSLLPNSHRYSDPDLIQQSIPSLIPHNAIHKIRDLIASSLLDEQNIARWFGQYMTQPKYPLETVNTTPRNGTPSISSAMTEAELRTVLQTQEVLYRNPGARLAIYHSNVECRLFFNGDSLTLPLTEKSELEHISVAEELSCTWVLSTLKSARYIELWRQLLVLSVFAFEPPFDE